MSFLAKSANLSLLFAAVGLTIAAVEGASAKDVFKRVPTQYVAALGDTSAKSGTGAETWGLWPVDPGPRGVRLSNFPNLKLNDGVAPANWKFDQASWWLEEHGLIMETPVFPIVPGKYVVTGGREATAVLTIEPKAAMVSNIGN